MSIVKMSKITVIGMAEDKSNVIDALMKLGAVELETEAETSVYTTGDGAEANLDDDLEDYVDRMSFQQTFASVEQTAVSDEELEHTASLDAMTRLEMAIEYLHELSGKTGKPQLQSATDRQLLEAGSREQEIRKMLHETERLRASLDDLHSQKAQQLGRYDLLLPWQGLQVDLAVRGTARTSLFIGSLDTVDQIAELKEALRQEAPESHVEIFRQDEAHALLAVVVWQPRENTAQAVLRRIGFHQMPLQGEQGTAGQLLEACHDRVKNIDLEIASMRGQLTEMIGNIGDFQLLHDFYLIRSEKYKAMKNISGSRSTFWLTGWVPDALAEDVVRDLSSSFMTAIDIRKAAKDEEHPILLKNPKPVKAYEVIVEMFSAPSSVKDIDPAPLPAPFFFFFFGMMLSDVGYGLLLSALCGVLIWKVKAGGELGRMARMLFISGIGSVLWGLMFGGFFGNMLTTLSDGKINMPALWFDPMSDPTRLMIWSMIFGVIHLFAGMGARIYILARAGKLVDGLLDIAPWYLIIIGLGLMLGGIGGQLGMYTALAGAAVLLLFGGRDAKNPIMRLLKGLLSIYNITSYFSDILSYTRILALVLATSVIAMVVNLLGFLLGPTPAGIIVFIIVALLGHTLNLALSALSAYVHTSRLQYVEFFSKFYEGGGRLWKPLSRKTKYVELKQDEAAS